MQSDAFSKETEREEPFFDCVGYTFARERNALFVTGDREFKDLPAIAFVKA